MFEFSNKQLNSYSNNYQSQLSSLFNDHKKMKMDNNSQCLKDDKSNQVIDEMDQKSQSLQDDDYVNQQVGYIESNQQDLKDNNVNQQIGQMFKNDYTEVIQYYNTQMKIFTIKKYFLCKNTKQEWENEVSILKQLQLTDITLKFVQEGEENGQYYLEQVCGLKDFLALKQDCMPYILKESKFNKRYDSFIAIQFIRLIQKLKKLHSLGFAHSDIKPSNIVIGYDFDPYFIDLGGAIKLDNYKDYLNQCTVKYNLSRYLEGASKKKYNFENKEQVIVCEFMQLSLAILNMITPNIKEYKNSFNQKYFKELIQKQIDKFPITTQLLDVVLNSTYSQNLTIDIDFKSLQQIMMKISDIQFNHKNSKFEVLRINNYSVNIINLIETQFQNISIPQNQVDVIPMKNNSTIFDNIIKKFKISPFKHTNKLTFGFGQLNNMFNLEQWVTSSNSQNQTFNIGIKSVGDMQMLLEILKKVDSDYNIRLNISFIDNKMVDLFLKKLKKIQIFQIASFNIYFIKDIVIQINLQQIKVNDYNEKDQSDKFRKYQLQQQEINEQQQKLRDEEDITIKKKKKQKQKSIKKIQPSPIDYNFVDSKDIRQIFLKHYSPFRGSIIKTDYNFLDLIYDLQKPLHVTFKIQNQRDFVSKFKETVENALKNFLNYDLKKLKTNQVIRKLSITIKYILRSSFQLFTKQQRKKDFINVYKNLYQDPETKDLIDSNKMNENNLNNLVVLENIENEYKSQQVKQFKQFESKVNDQIQSYLNYLLNPNTLTGINQIHLNSKSGKLILQFNEFLINDTIYNIITQYLQSNYDESHLIDLVFQDCYYDLKILKSIIQLCSFYSVEYYFEEKIVEKESKVKYSLKFDYFNQNEKREKMRIIFITSSQKDKISSSKNLEANKLFEESKRESKNNLIKLNDITQIFNQNENNIQLIILKAKHLKTFKQQSKTFQINYSIKNLNVERKYFSKKNINEELKYIKNAQSSLSLIKNNLYYEFHVINQWEYKDFDISDYSLSYYKKRQQEMKQMQQRQGRIYDSQCLQSFIKDIQQMINQTHIFKQDNDQQINTQYIKEVFELILSKSENTQIAQDPYSFEVIMFNVHIELSSLQVLIKSLSQFLSRKCIKPLNRLYIQLDWATIEKEQMNNGNQHYYLNKIDEYVLNIDLIVLEFQKCESENTNYQQFSRFISNIVGNNVYIYLPKEYCDLQLLQKVTSNNLKSKKLLLDLKKNKNQKLIYTFFDWILKSNKQNHITFRIQTKQPQLIQNRFKSFIDQNYKIQQQNYQEDIFTADELIISYKGQIPYNKQEFKLQIRCYEKDIVFPSSEDSSLYEQEDSNLYKKNDTNFYNSEDFFEKKDNKFNQYSLFNQINLNDFNYILRADYNQHQMKDSNLNQNKNSNFQQNIDTHSNLKFLAACINYKTQINKAPQSIKSHIYIQAPISLEVEQDLQNFVFQTPQDYLEMQHFFLKDEFNYNQFQNYKKQEDQGKDIKEIWKDELQNFNEIENNEINQKQNKEQLEKYQYQSEIEQFNEEYLYNQQVQYIRRQELKDYQIIEQYQLPTDESSDSDEDEVQSKSDVSDSEEENLYNHPESDSSDEERYDSDNYNDDNDYDDYF